MSAIKRVARAGLHRAGGLDLFRRFKRGFRILTYHRFTPELADRFEQQCRDLRTYYEPVSMGEIAHHVQAKTKLHPRAVAVTVDDGYRDFFEIAAPILRTHGIPATVFLVGSFIDRREWLWWDRLGFALLNTSRSELRYGLNRVAPLSTSEARTAAYNAITEDLKKLPNPERLSALDDLLGQLDVNQPAEVPAEYAPLSWDEVRLLRKAGIEFGGHTYTHPILSRLATPEEIQSEVVLSKERIERELGERAIHFSYPNGQRADWNDCVLRAVKAAGYTTGVTTVGGVNGTDYSPLLLRRIAVDPDVPREYFAELVAGMHGVG